MDEDYQLIDHTISYLFGYGKIGYLLLIDISIFVLTIYDNNKYHTGFINVIYYYLILELIYLGIFWGSSGDNIRNYQNRKKCFSVLKLFAKICILLTTVYGLYLWSIEITYHQIINPYIFYYYGILLVLEIVYFFLGFVFMFLITILFKKCLRHHQHPRHSNYLRIAEDVSNIHLFSSILQMDDIYQNHMKCTICLEDYISTDKIKILPCRHYYHYYCIQQWMENHSECPYCRQNIFLSQDEAI